MLIAAWLLVLPASAEEHDATAIDTEWRALIAPLLPLGSRLAKEFPQAADPLLRQELFRFIYSELGAGFMQLASNASIVPPRSRVTAQLISTRLCTRFQRGLSLG